MKRFVCILLSCAILFGGMGAVSAETPKTAMTGLIVLPEGTDRDALNALLGEIAEDITAYLTESEQVPSACALGVLVDTDRSIKAAGGFIVQLMPGADEALIGKLEENIFLMDQLTTILDEDGPEAVFEQVLKGLEHHIVGEKEIEYRCYCSHERVKDALRSIGREELGHIAAEGKDISVSCQFCDRVYSFTPAEIRELADGEAE